MKKFILLTLAFGSWVMLQSQDVKQDFNTNSISIFKNGTAFFIKSGQVDPAEGVYTMKKNLPPALSGTFWITSPNNQVESVSGYVDTLEVAQQTVARSMFELLNANLGKRVRVFLSGDQVVEGIAEDIGQNDPANGQAQDHPLVSLKLSNRWISLAKNDIRRIEFSEQPDHILEWNKKEIKPVLVVEFKNSGRKQPLNMMYLAQGLNWTPTYLLELLEDKKARLKLSAEVTNNTEDIEGTDVNFVVGVPNFKHANAYSSLINFFREKLNSRGLRPQTFSNTFQGQTYAQYDDFTVEDISVSSTTTGLEGSSTEDLYFYTLKDMNLRKGGSGQYPVFEAEIEIAHIYECNLPQNNERKNSYASEYLFNPSPNKVFHSVRVNNSTPYPFTTGPILVVKQEQETKPISQDQLNYTSINDHSFVKLTEAPDVRIKQAEKATGREERVKRVKRQNGEFFYDLITVEGQIIAKNNKSKDIDLNIRRPIIGELKKSNVKWLKAERVNTSGSPNNTTDVCWETSIKAGEELKINYSYQVYVLN